MTNILEPPEACWGPPLPVANSQRVCTLVSTHSRCRSRARRRRVAAALAHWLQTSADRAAVSAVAIAACATAAAARPAA